MPPPPIKDIVFNQRTQVPLAKDKVRHVGEPVALVIAESRYLAEDAAGDIVVDYEPLPAVVDLEAALAPGARLRPRRPRRQRRRTGAPDARETTPRRRSTPTS